MFVADRKVPEQWKRTDVLPIFKERDLETLNCRLVSAVNVVYKTIYKISENNRLC